jgi:hypothetical protein
MERMIRPGPKDSIHRPRWLDPRLGIGALLVIASVVGVVLLVASADRTSAVYVATGPFVTGDRITRDDLSVARVRLGGTEEHYLRPDDDFPAGGVVAVRPIEEGELVPAGSVGSADADASASVVIPLAGALAGSIAPGSRVVVWASATKDGGGYRAPAVIVSEALVVRLVERQSGAFSAGDDEQVEIRVPRDTVAVVLEATANDSALALVPLDRPLGG